MTTEHVNHENVKQDHQDQSHEKQDHVQKTFHGEYGNLSLKMEGLNDGYRITVKSTEAEMKSQRRVGAAVINAARQAEKAGWKLPWPIRMVLWFWDRYK